MLLLLEGCSALLPNDTQLMADLGGEYEAIGRVAEAENTYQRALAVEPGYADLRLRLGRLMFARGDAGQARRQAEAALRVQPNRKELVDLLDTATAALTRP